jgi:hypothetical protein
MLPVALAAPLAAQNPTPPGARWPMHAPDRPRPPVVAPSPPREAPPPADAIVLFGGGALDAWAHDDDTPARWIVRGGELEVRPGSGGIRTRQAFGDVQLHLEWSAPPPPRRPAGKARNAATAGCS